MPAFPVNLAVHSRAFARCGTDDRVPHEFAFFAHVDDREVTELARVVRLTATGRIKRRAVECDRSISRRDDRRLERREVCVAKVEQFGQ
jgi:hypothetical protein